MTIIYCTKDDKFSAVAHASYSKEKVQSIDELLDETNEITISYHTNVWATKFGAITPAKLAEKLAASYRGNKSTLTDFSVHDKNLM